MRLRQPDVATVAPTSTVAPDLSVGTPGLVTGLLRYDAGTTFGEFQEDFAVDGGQRQRGREVHATSEMSDAASERVGDGHGQR